MPFIFLCYSHKDSEYTNRLADSLEAKGLEVWIDKRIDYGVRWSQVILEQVDRCTAFVVVMTLDSFESEWVQAELTRARRLRKPTFPLLLEGDVWLALEATQYVDVRGAKLPPARFYDELADVLRATPTTNLRGRLQTELGELQRRYDNLTSRIRAMDTDLGREPDSERRLMLEERRAELAASREKASARMVEIEAQLKEIAEQKPPPVQVKEPEPEVKPPAPSVRSEGLLKTTAKAEPVQQEVKQPPHSVVTEAVPTASDHTAAASDQGIVVRDSQNAVTIDTMHGNLTVTILGRDVRSEELEPMPNVFISYVRDNSEQVDKLADELRRHGVTVWLDRDDILPGADWEYAIRQAIEGGDYFIACFSAEYVARRKTYMHTEIGLAIEMLQQMPIGRIWFIPVLLSDCQVPALSIGGGRTLTRLNWEPLHKDWERGIRRILKAMGVEPAVKQPVPTGRTEAPAPVKAAPVPPLADDLLVIDKPNRLELIRIPAGGFLMGNDYHPVDVAEFYIGKYPITHAQYATFVQAKNYERPRHWGKGRIPAGKENHPVVSVSWRDSVAFCDWLSEATGLRFRLPTEAEWEKAARGGLRIPGPDGAQMDNPLPDRQYPWGDKFDAGKCNTRESGIGDTTPVGKYSPKGDSPYGVADMAGNVWEWCLNEHSSGKTDLGGSAARVLRGGSWYDYDSYAAAPFRNYYFPPDSRLLFLGFRVVFVGWRPNA